MSNDLTEGQPRAAGSVRPLAASYSSRDGLTGGRDGLGLTPGTYDNGAQAAGPINLDQIGDRRNIPERISATELLDAMRTLKKFASLDTNDLLALTNDSIVARELPDIMSAINARMKGMKDLHNK